MTGDKIPHPRAPRGHAWVIVMGDIARSPRMRYHADCLTAKGLHVDFVGYTTTELPLNVTSNPLISIHSIDPAPHLPIPRLLQLIITFAWLFFALLAQLLFDCSAAPTVVLLQNPPGIPSIFAVRLAAWVRCARLLVVDWHNYTYSLLQAPAGLRRICSRLEGYSTSQLANAHICVSDAMKHDLEKRWGVFARVVQDCPDERFKPTSLEEQHSLWLRLSEQIGMFADVDDTADMLGIFPGNGAATTRFTCRRTTGYERIANSPRVIVSSTSWTPDEDFGILLDALSLYDKQAERESSLPRVIAVITGRGPQKEMYLQRIRELHLERVEICTPWLTAEDYPLLLAASDLGVCLHTSSSGVDLPMKCVDMFGASLPAIALRFPAIGELVTDQRGFLFDTSEELCDSLIRLLSTEEGAGELERRRTYLTQHRMPSFKENWEKQFWNPVLSKFFI